MDGANAKCAKPDYPQILPVLGTRSAFEDRIKFQTRSFVLTISGWFGTNRWSATGQRSEIDCNFAPTEIGASNGQRSAETVKNIIVALVAALAASSMIPVMAQDAAKPAAPAVKDTTPHRVGLVDMAEVFQGYKKFEDLRAGLAAEIEKSDAEAKLMVEKMQKMQLEMQESKLAPGSPQYEQAEKTLLGAKGEFEAFRAATQRKLARRESEMFKVIYADTTMMVQKYAEYAKYTMVVRFDRKDIDENTAPAEAVQRMNKQVVYYRAEDDITDVVLSTLNSKYEGATGASKAPVRGVSDPAVESNKATR
jgi:outer membrane protein